MNMSYKLSLTIPDAQLQAVLKSLSGRKVEVEYVADVLKLQAPDTPVKAARQGKIPMTAKLSVGATAPRSGTNYEVVVKTLQKLEVKHGPHRVTRGHLRDALSENSEVADWVRNEGITQSVRSGYLEAS